MRAVVIAILVSACSFEHREPFGAGDGGTSGGDGGGGSTGDGGGTMTDSGPTCAWSYTPTNFDPCMLPAPGTLTVSGTVNLNANTTTLPKLVLAQDDGSTLTVIHLSQLTVNGFSNLVINDTAVVLAVDGQASINGTITVIGGQDNSMQCATARGVTGADSDDTNSGAGGGGGAGAGEAGGGGGAGNGVGAGAGGAHGGKVTNTFTPLHAGCRGGNGGRFNGTGTSPQGGRGGGALQISTNTKISIGGGAAIDAAGRGGSGGSAAHVGGAGGGSGGTIFLEGPQLEFGFASLACADGGSGGEGGGASMGGNDGRAGGCTSLTAAQTQTTISTTGGRGGDGGFAGSRTGSGGGSSTSGAGAGGGGGGAVGWIRIKSNNISNGGLVTTPQASN